MEKKKKPKPIKGLPKTSDIVEVYQKAHLDPKTLALLIILRNSMNTKNKKCWKGYSYLAKEMNVGRNTAYRAVQKAVEARLITIEKFERNSGYDGNRYRFNFPWPVPKMVTGSTKSCTQNGDRACTQNGDSYTQSGDMPVPKMVLKSRQSKSSTKESVKDNQEEDKSSSKIQKKKTSGFKKNQKEISREKIGVKLEVKGKSEKVVSLDQIRKREKELIKLLKQKGGDELVEKAQAFALEKIKKNEPRSARPYGIRIWESILNDEQPDFKGWTDKRNKYIKRTSEKVIHL